MIPGAIPLPHRQWEIGVHLRVPLVTFGPH